MPRSRVSGIYEIVNLVNGKRYVGSAAHIPTRWSVHKHLLRRSRHHSAALQRAWDKYGPAAFEMRVRLLCPRDGLLEHEQAAIDAVRPEYNVALFAGRSILPAEAVERRAAKRRGRKMGPMAVEHRAAIAASLVGKRLSADHAAAISRAKRGCKRPDMAGNKYGSIVRTPEHCANMSAAQRGKKKSPETIAKMKAAWVLRKAKNRQA